ncbi:hypothetical protein HPSA50_0328 [Helicobacter pylori SouthAfrica50]|uniref:Uncharacterized protein n=1 Tax=Helicobacter pylori SouthAfrica50 TaxID=1352357 RepID=T2SBB6_HELPX|nr:hypothetical protein HPSA50_0328 [Helicobacter pylori SouthAfrica50]
MKTFPKPPDISYPFKLFIVLVSYTNYYRDKRNQEITIQEPIKHTNVRYKIAKNTNKPHTQNPQ